jgi:dimethylaniline monooxygenase (N-oxide forming)
MMDYFCNQITKKHFVIDPAWRLFPGPSLTTHVPLVHDKIVSLLEAGDVVSVHGISHFVDASTVELSDGTKLEVDAVIYCTGYEPEFSLLGPDLDPTKRSNGETRSGLARLYQNIFPPRHSDSVAYMNYARINMGADTISDICSLAIAQVWKGGYALPSEKDMEAEIDKHHAWIDELSKENKDAYWHGMVKEGSWLEFLDTAAGMGINENLGYGWKAWKFWWKERGLCDLIMVGVNLPYVYRLFEGRRKRWEGAREAIVRINKEAKRYGSK